MCQSTEDLVGHLSLLRDRITFPVSSTPEYSIEEIAL